MTQSEQPDIKWYQGLDRYCWIVLVIAALGWLFDTTGMTHGFRHSFAMAATAVSFIYIFGFIGAYIGPETMGKPLPEDKDFEEPQPEPELAAKA